MEMRTNNIVESYHSRWNDDIGVAHPNVWLLIRYAKEQEVLRGVCYRSMVNGEAPPLRRWKWRQLEEKINEKKRNLLANRISTDGYWNQVKHVIKDFS